MFRVNQSIRAALALALTLPLAAPALAGGKTLNAPADKPATSRTVLQSATAVSRFVPNLIVKFKGSTGSEKERLAIVRQGAERAQRVASVAARHGVAVNFSRRLATGGDLFHFDHPVSQVEAFRMAMEVRRANPDVQYAEPDLILHKLGTGTYTPNDPDFPSQWDMFDPAGGIDAQAAWSTTLGKGAVVAVLDTGVRPHVDLVANLLPGYNFVTTANQPAGTGWTADGSDPGDYCSATGEPSSWHGTHVAGTIAAVGNNGIGISGVAPQAKVVPVRVLGQCGGATSDIVDGMIWAAGGSVPGVAANPNPAKAMNLSLGGENPCMDTFHDAINQVIGLGSAVVVAAGNASHNVRDDEPASCPGVIAVGSVNKSGGRAYYSNYGGMVTVSAPGGEMFQGGDQTTGILSTLNDGQTTPGNDIYGYYQGTSQATPHVTGTIALMLSVNPNLTPAQIRQILTSTARPFSAYCAGCGAGIVDANAAVHAAATASASK